MGKTETQEKEIILAKPSGADHRRCVDLRNANAHFFFSPGRVTLTNHHDWYRRVERDETRLFYVVKLGPDVIGTIGLSHIDYYHKHAEYGQFIIGEEWRGMGYGRRALRALLRKAFGEFDLHRIYGDIFWGNTVSQRTAFSLGFIEEGQFKDHIRTASGEFVDAVRVAILRDNFDG